MDNVLDRICADKRKHIAACKAIRSVSEVETAARETSAPRGFADALHRASKDGYGLISEIKRSSPSKGLIRPDFDPAVLATAYQFGGATCISVLTDTPYFDGNDDHLIKARNAVELPILRKDFMLDPYQIYEARALGADCILLIMAALSQKDAVELEKIAISLGMDALLEVHNEIELAQAMTLQSPLIGVNNRNLKTLNTDTNTTKMLASQVPSDKILISESGLYTPDDLSEMANAGARCFLIGESLMRQDDVAEAVRTLLTNPVPAPQMEQSL
ncbi:MAG: indole-3-glycerol phosphate synthase TrpC [Alphaproteobacteria bacterium]|nr:indole-3-glycerol phosphate synthase TrpC [Alphaproteobacteria bacterium]